MKEVIHLICQVIHTFGPLNVNEKCSIFIQLPPANTSDLSHHTYHIQKQDVDGEYLGKVKMALNSHVGSINFADPANIRKAHKEIMT